MTPSWYLVALAFVLGAAISFVVGDVIRTVRRTGRRADPPQQVEQVEERGELLHLDWSDARQPDDGASVFDVGSRHQ